MIKTTRELEPGDAVYVNGRRVVIEMTAEDGRVYHIRHTQGGGWFKADAQWLVEEPLDVIKEAEALAGAG